MILYVTAHTDLSDFMLVMIRCFAEIITADITDRIRYM